jgi:hypothetical protein
MTRQNNRYSLDGKIQSTYAKGHLIESKDFKHGKWETKGLESWANFLGVDTIKKGISYIWEDFESDPVDFKRTKIATEFSMLKTEKEIDAFARKYGLLGFSTPKYLTKEQHEWFREKYGISNELFFLSQGYPYFEPLEVWYFHIDQIQKILKLYKTLKNIHNGTEENNIECNLLNIGEMFVNEKGEKGYYIEWYDGVEASAVVEAEIVEAGDFLEIARIVLIKSVEYLAYKNLKIVATDIIKTDKPPLGFYVQESKTTEHLITAIYYDVWELISNNEPISICENPNCKLPFPKEKKEKRKRYCNDACKSEAYRTRKSTAKKMHEEGHSIEHIAKELEVSRTSVVKWIQ